MNLYLLTNPSRRLYDIYDKAVVAAPDAETAKTIHPNGHSKVNKNKCSNYDCWCAQKNVGVLLIGIAGSATEQGVICASYNAG